MPGARAAIAFALCLTGFAVPMPLAASTVNFNIWPSADPDAAIYCSVSLNQGRLVVIEAKGLGLQRPHPMQWWATDADTAAFLHAVQALISGEVPSDYPDLAARPAPPFLTVTWIAHLDGRITTGRYVAADLAVPPALAQMLAVVTPNGRCDLR